MRVLVTGGAGYVGSITTRRLLDAGHEVAVLDTLEKGHAAAVDARATLVTGDIADEQLLDWYDRVHGLRSVRYRYFNVAGA